MGELPIRNSEEAVDYLLLEKGMADATAVEVAYGGAKTWLISSRKLPPSIDGGDLFWLLENGRLVNTHVLDPNLPAAYKRQFGEPFASVSEGANG